MQKPENIEVSPDGFFEETIRSEKRMTLEIAKGKKEFLTLACNYKFVHLPSKVEDCTVYTHCTVEDYDTEESIYNKKNEILKSIEAINKQISSGHKLTCENQHTSMKL